MWSKFQDKIRDPIAQRRLVLVIVCIALLLDKMLSTVIVPIILRYLTELNQHKVEINFLYKYYNVTDVTSYVKGVTDSYVMAYKVNKSSSLQNGAYVNVPEEATLASNDTIHFLENKDNRIYLLRIPVSPPPISYGDGGLMIGVLFASKAIFQILVNPFTGGLIDRIGYDIPMMIGLTIMFFSTIMFAFGNSYGFLFLARALQGLGSAFADTAGLAMIADRFRQEEERSKALGIALAFISFGSLVAPPFGGILYEFTSKTVPFVILALVCIIDGVLMVLVMRTVRLERSRMTREDRPKGSPIYKLLLDPYIAVCVGALAISTVFLAFPQPTIAMWIKITMDADQWAIGFVGLPAFIPYVCGVYLTVNLAKEHPQYQWLMAMIGLIMQGCFCLFLPFYNTFVASVVPLMWVAFGNAMVDTIVLPTLGYLVDVRHVSVYGSVYAIADMSYSLAYAIGPFVAGSIVQTIGFTWLNILIFLTNVAYAPLLISLRNIYKPVDKDVELLKIDHQPTEYDACIQNGGKPGAE